MHYYNHHLGDYAKDTGHLSLAEHGAYRMLLDHYYSTEKPLPLNADAVCRICRATTRLERDAVTSVLAQFFTASSDGYAHKRVEREISEYKQRSEAASRAGKLSGEMRRMKAEQRTTVERPLNDRCVSVDHSVEPTKNQEPITSVLLGKEPKGAGAPGEAKRRKVEDQEDFEAACRVTLDSNNPALLQAWEEWQAYRQRRHRDKRGQHHVPWTLRAAQLSAKQILQAAETHTPQVVADRITSAVVGYWQGLNLDKLNNSNGHAHPSNRQSGSHRADAPRFAALAAPASDGEGGRTLDFRV